MKEHVQEDSAKSTPYQPKQKINFKKPFIRRLNHSEDTKLIKNKLY